MAAYEMQHLGEHAVFDQIMEREESGAAILMSEMITRECMTEHDTGFPWIKDVIGIVAMLGKVDHHNLSKMLAKYVGQNVMMSIVCKTYDGVKSLETYFGMNDRIINKNTGLHGFARVLGKNLNGRFDVICLEQLVPYVGNFVLDDPQRKLDLEKPKLPSGNCPEGFLGYAVNMIKLDIENVHNVTASGHGLRETLFYNIFSHVQVYQTREQMQQASTCITDGALSLDGTIMKSPVSFTLGSPEGEVDVWFVVNPHNWVLPAGYTETVKKLNFIKSKKEERLEKVEKEEMLPNQVKRQKH